MTTIRTPRELANIVRGRRLDVGLTQTELARRAEVSRDWLSRFEKGKPTVELGHVLRLLEALGLHLDVSADTTSNLEPRPGQVDLDELLDTFRDR